MTAKRRSVAARQTSASSTAGKSQYLLRLYIIGATEASARAVERVRAFCDAHLSGRYELEVIDIYQLPALAKEHQIIATPTLIKVLPEPLRRFIGDATDMHKAFFGMDLLASEP